jgi:hypothetical protein
MKETNHARNLARDPSHEAKEIRHTKSHGYRSERHACPANADMEVNVCALVHVETNHFRYFRPS